MPKTHQYKFKAEKIRNSRFTCSTASAPSRSNTTLRTRRRSTTSSVAGDSLLVRREARKIRNASGSKVKPRTTKCNLRNQRKGFQPGKSLRPSTGILQNAIVLAPFHTLKRCFQNKLVDLYSHEKMKKINRKMKMAEKQKMSFEYDIVELNRLGTNVKKEGKGSKPQQKLRSPSYCQCDRALKADYKKPPNTLRKEKEPDHVFIPQVSTFLGHLEKKRRKLDSPPLTPSIFKAELSSRVDFCSANTSLPSDTNLTGSRLSSRSKSDSSDTNNSPSYRDERLTGSLAISTTSFDSCLEHFDRPNCDCPSTALPTTKRTKTRRSSETDNPDCLPKPNANLSRHLIMHNGMKNSDGRIVDFLDREPQSQVISSVESSHRLQPLPRRLSKTRATAEKKPENAAATGYYLRSLTPGKEPLPTERSRSPRGSSLKKNRILQIEVATQVEGISLESATPVKDVLRDPAPVCASALREDALPESASEEKPNPEEPIEKCSSPCEATIESMVSPVDILSEDMEAGSGQSLPEGPAATDSFDLAPDLEERFQGSSALGRAQDEESNFIFGPRNTASRLGESCKFSFGLNFVFSDDED